MNLTFKKIVTGSIGMSLLLSLCTGCKQPTESTTTPSPEPVESPIVTAEPTPSPIPSPIPEPSTDPIPEPTELVYEMVDNPKGLQPYDASVKLLELMEKSLTYSLSQDTYIVQFDENIENIIADTVPDFNYRQFNVYKNGKNVNFDGLNGKRFYIGSFEQDLGGEPENIVGKNAFGSYTSALNDVGFNNGLNDIYKLFTDDISLGETAARKIYMDNPESISINYVDLEDGRTQYDLSFINMSHIDNIGKYIERSPRNYIEGMRTTFSFVINQTGLVDEIFLEDKMNLGEYGSFGINRKANFTYSSEYAFDNNIQYGTDKLLITVEAMNKDISLGTVVSHRNPNSAEISGGVDATSWTAVYKRMSDGAQKSVQVNASSKSNYNVNGITSGMSYTDAVKHMDSVITLNEDLLIGIINKDNSSFTVLCYLNDGKVGDIETKINPKKLDYIDIKKPGELTESIEACDFIRAFQPINETIPNALYKSLLRNFEIEQTLQISGQNLNKYADKTYGSLIYIDNGYKQGSLDRENEKLLSPARVFDDFIKNAPVSSFKNLDKAENEDGSILYTGKISIDKQKYEQLIKIAGDYDQEMLDTINSAPAPTELDVRISTHDGYIDALMFKMSSKRDCLEYNLKILYF